MLLRHPVLTLDCYSEFEMSFKRQKLWLHAKILLADFHLVLNSHSLINDFYMKYFLVQLLSYLFI